MVAREKDIAAPASGFAIGLFMSWRRLLSRTCRGLGRAAGASLDASREAPAAVLAWERELVAGVRGCREVPLASARLGVALAALGTALGLAAGTLADGSLLGAALFTGETSAWALFRLLALVATSGAPRGQRTAIFAVWGTGLLPYALGVTPGLRAAAFIGSALLTLRLLARVMHDSPAARRAVAVAFGGQAVAAVASWIVINGLVFLPLLGR